MNKLKYDVVTITLHEDIILDLELLTMYPEHGVIKVVSKNYSGADFFIEILVGTITSTAAVILSNVISDAFAKNKKISFKKNGVEISGLTLDEALKLLENQKSKK